MLAGTMAADPLNDTPPMFLAVVRVAAEPEVFWFPDELTPGRVMFPVPSNDTPPMSRAVAKAVAVAALPVAVPALPEQLPVTLPVRGPVNTVATNEPVPAL
jgi:hypothetical protein